MTDRPPLLFLHGAFAGPEVWTRFVAPWFARRGHRVAAPVMPGRTNPAARMRDYVRAAREAADELGRPIAIGHSLGGLVAQHLAAEGRLSGAVLVSSPGPFGLAPTLWRLSSFAPDVLAALLIAQAGAGAQLGPDEIRRALFTADTPDDWIAALDLTLSPESHAVFADGLTWDLPVWPLGRATPMLALLGEKDAFVPVTDLWTIGLAYGAETALLPGVAHGLPLDPAWKSLAWRISTWMSERQIGGRQPRPWLTAFGFGN